jgi:hypothetical protein
MIAAETSQQRYETMTNENRELSLEQLGAVTGGGIVDKVLPESEAATTEFLKKFAEASQRFSAFINSPTTQSAAAANPE